jgi:hypothetical protein
MKTQQVIVDLHSIEPMMEELAELYPLGAHWFERFCVELCPDVMTSYYYHFDDQPYEPGFNFSDSIRQITAIAVVESVTSWLYSVLEEHDMLEMFQAAYDERAIVHLITQIVVELTMPLIQQAYRDKWVEALGDTTVYVEDINKYTARIVFEYY